MTTTTFTTIKSQRERVRRFRQMEQNNNSSNIPLGSRQVMAIRQNLGEEWESQWEVVGVQNYWIPNRMDGSGRFVQTFGEVRRPMSEGTHGWLIEEEIDGYITICAPESTDACSNGIVTLRRK